uniref:Endonuclease/exonuclease/phosphatase domain-containing protein n=1 Tax=Photinus pyralis TaxID=7054 RepID=A0A1Y1LGD1_PHOPY
MDEAIIHWNCNGIIHHLCEFKLLLQEKDPFCVCLQETHLRPGQPYSLRNYSIVRKDLNTGQRAHGGVAIIIKEHFPFNQIQVNTPLQVVAIQILIPIKITICSIYLAPDEQVHTANIWNVVRQLPTPFIIVGDFNAHNPLWGSTRLDNRGEAVENLLESRDITLLNNGSATHIAARSGAFSAIDLAISSSAISDMLRWTVLEDLYNSDHYPCEVKKNTAKTNQQISRYWILSRANWEQFENKVLMAVEGQFEVSIELITNIIQQAANESIPIGGGETMRRRVPWWNAEIATAIKEKKRALHVYKRVPVVENLIVYKRARARSRRLMLDSRRKSWTEYVSSLMTDSPPSEVWNKVRAIKGRSSHRQITHLRTNGADITTNSMEIANTMVQYFANISSTENYSADFKLIKLEREVALNFEGDNDLAYNAPFQFFELEEALKYAKKSAPGPDMINYQMIQHLPARVKQALLAIYNKLWQEGDYPTVGNQR